MAHNRNNHSVNTFLGPGTRVVGVIESSGFTRIDGIVHGDVNAQGSIVIGDQARLKGNLSGTAVTVGGVVHGDIFADERIIILASAIILGNIITRRIQADEGCLIHGKVFVCKSDDEWNKAVAEQKQYRQTDVKVNISETSLVERYG